MSWFDASFSNLNHNDTNVEDEPIESCSILVRNTEVDDEVKYDYKLLEHHSESISPEEDETDPNFVCGNFFEQSHETVPEVEEDEVILKDHRELNDKTAPGIISNSATSILMMSDMTSKKSAFKILEAANHVSFAVKMEQALENIQDRSIERILSNKSQVYIEEEIRRSRALLSFLKKERN